MTEQPSPPSRTSTSGEAASTQALVEATAQSTLQAMAQVTAEQVYAKATRPWFKKKRFALPSAVVLVFLLIMVSTGGNDPRIFDLTTNPVEARAETANNLPIAAIGQSVRDGKFAFIVTSMARPTKTITDRSGTTETAQGVFVIVRITVTNTGYYARTLTATNQFLISDTGQRFATSPAISSLTGAETIFLEKINPGHTVNDAPLLFDVPLGTTIASIELHDLVSSSGAEVKLT